MSEKIDKSIKKQVIDNLTISEILDIVRTKLPDMRATKKDKLSPRDFYLKKNIDLLTQGDRPRVFESSSRLGEIVFSALPVIDAADEELRRVDGYSDTLTAKEFSDWKKNTSGVAEMFKSLEVSAIELVTKACPDPRVIQNRVIKGIIFGQIKEKERAEKAEKNPAQDEQVNTKQNDTAES